MWDKQFEEILREYLPFLGGTEPLAGDAELRDLGLDSIATVELLARLEAAYDVRFLDESLSKETFATPSVLWATTAALTGAAH